MTAKEYLQQARRLDQRIDLALRDAKSIREKAESVRAVGYDREHVQSGRSTDAPFVGPLERLWELEERISMELESLAALRNQIRTVIDAVPDADGRLVLRYRYIHGMTWEQIAREMNADARTIRRWHGRALQEVRVPEKPVMI